MKRKNIYLLILMASAFVFSAQIVSAQAPTVSKVEPPNWWANHSISTVRLLVRGENFQNAKVVSKNNRLKTANVRVNQRGDYLFFDVEIAKNAKIGRYDFEVSTAKGKTSVPFEIAAPVKTDNQTITNDDVIYLIMTDRFADGDASNNKDVDRANPRMWHGGDFRGIQQKIPYLKELGITAIWLTPWYDNADEPTICDKPWCPMSFYHGYGSIDHYGVENHFGTFQDLREMIETAHKNGIKVIQDQVVNHKGFRHPWMKSAPLDNWFTPFEQTRFNNSALLSPNSPKSELDNTLKGWFDFSLPDMNYDEPEVARYEIQNALWWIGATGIDGIRQDTIQYVPRAFIRDWSAAILKQYPNFYMVGEIYDFDPVHTSFFQGGRTGWDGIDTKLPSVFDFNLMNVSRDVFTGKKPMRALRDALKYDGLYGDVNRVTTFTGNHDIDRFMSLPGATKEGAKLYTAFMLSTRGIPQMYYGDEILMTGGHDPDNRKDFAGGFAGDKTDKFTKEGRTADEQEMFEWTRDWIKLRKENRALREGKMIDLFYDNDVYVFSRIFVESNGFDHFGEVFETIVAVNASNAEKRVKIFSNFGNDKRGLCFENQIGADNFERSLKFEKESVRTKTEKGDCFFNSGKKFEFAIPAKQIISFRIRQSPV